MKPAHAALLKEIDALAAKLGHKQRTWLRVIVAEGEDEKPAMEKAVAAWQAAHPRAKPRTIDDFEWSVRLLARSWAVSPDVRPSGSASSNSADVFADEERKRQFRRRLHYPPAGLV
jgi:hypothetical protein